MGLISYLKEDWKKARQGLKEITKTDYKIRAWGYFGALGLAYLLATNKLKYLTMSMAFILGFGVVAGIIINIYLWGSVFINWLKGGSC